MKRLMLRRRGASAIEFALTLPVLTFILLAVIEYGTYFFQLTSMTNAVRDGCRLAVRADDPITTAEAQTRAVLKGFGLDCDAIPSCQVTATVTAQASGYDTLRVAARFDYTQITGMVPSPDAVGAQMTMMLESSDDD